jgi:hypothetical protein
VFAPLFVLLSALSDHSFWSDLTLRYVFKSDELFTEILFCMKGFNVPLLQQFQTYGGLVGTYAQNKAELGTVFEVPLCYCLPCLITPTVF